MTRLGQLSVFWHQATQTRIFLATLLLVFLSISQVSSPTQADDLYPLDFDPLYDLPLPPAWSDTAGFATTAGDLLDRLANQTQVLVRVDLRLPAVNRDRLDEDQRAQWAADQAAVEQALLDSLPDGSYQRLDGTGPAVAETQSADNPDPAALALAPVKASSLTLAVDEAALAGLMASDRVAQVHQASASQTRIAAGNTHSMFIAGEGSLWAWGRNDYGQLGDGTNTRSSQPKQILLFDVTAVAAGDYHTLALKTDGSLWAWGHNGYGQLGDQTKTHRYTPTSILTGVAAVAAGAAHTLALKTNGSLWTWGYNRYGQLGNGKTQDSSMPQQILTNVIAMAAGDDHTLALKTDGSLWAWGKNDYGQLGDGTKTNRYLPTSKPILTNVAAVAAGASHTLALKTDGSLWAWGKNDYGQLGDGTKTHWYMPMSKPILTDVAAVVAGDTHSLALKTDGSLWAWGRNDLGQLGDETKTHRYTPQQINLTGVAALAAGDDHSLALKTDGSLWAWGYNGSGQLGNGTTINQYRPIKVMGSTPNTTTVTVAATDASASEGGLTTGTFTFTRSGNTSSALTVRFNVSGTATAGSDYTSLGTSVSFSTGQTTVTKVVNPRQDTLIEADETVILTLAAGTGYTVGTPNSATVTLTSDDVIPNVTVVATDASASEAGLTTGTFTFTRSGSTDAALTVRFSVGGTATANSDFTSLGTSVSFPVGKSQATKIVIPRQDTRVEANETVILTLAAGSGYTVSTPNNATVTLTSDD